MGMYTELVLNVALTDELPADVLSILKFMTGQQAELVGDHPKHPLFQTDRWEWMLRSASFYFIPEAQSKIVQELEDTFHLSIRCDLKNYSSEIESFLDWVAPYVEDFGDPVFGGYKRYEEADHPTLVYFNAGTVEYRPVT